MLLGRCSTEVTVYLPSPSPRHSCSEHSRHWFFKGQLHVDGKKLARSLFESIMSTQASSNPNNVLKFCDNSRLAMPWAEEILGWRRGMPWTLVGLAWILGGKNRV